MRFMVMIALFSLCACSTVKMQMELPRELKRYEDAAPMKLISADGVRVKGRVVDNYPRGDLAFWSDAMKAHLDARGYVFKAKRCFKTKTALDGCTLDFVVARGSEDWWMSETIFVVDDRILLVEAAAPYESLAKLETSYAKALESFTPTR